MKKPGEAYLGDGLYCSDDGYQFGLRAPRMGHDCEVFLDSSVLHEFIAFIERSRNLKITIEPLAPTQTSGAV